LRATRAICRPCRPSPPSAHASGHSGHSGHFRAARAVCWPMRANALCLWPFHSCSSSVALADHERLICGSLSSHVSSQPTVFWAVSQRVSSHESSHSLRR
jgi:hypothetical protein